MGARFGGLGGRPNERATLELLQCVRLPSHRHPYNRPPRQRAFQQAWRTTHSPSEVAVRQQALSRRIPSERSPNPSSTPCRYWQLLPITWLWKRPGTDRIVEPDRNSCVYVDESKDPTYVLAAVYVAPSRAAGVRRLLGGELVGGQSRIHMAHENRRRQTRLASMLLNEDLPIFIYSARARRHPRDALVWQLGCDAWRYRASLVTLELDTTTVRADKQTLEALRRQRVRDQFFQYRHLGPREEPLLWLPDIAAWMWNSRKYRSPLPFTHAWV